MKKLAVITVLLMTSCADNDSVPPELMSQVDIFMADPIAVRRGEALFLGSCAEYCHTTQAPVADSGAALLFDCEWVHAETDVQLFDVIINGIPGTRMVAYGENFPEGSDDVRKIIAYIRANQQTCEFD